jgi:hypothetical protein
MKKVLVRFLVPQRDERGNVSYRLEAQWLRLPVRRNDRRALMERLGD